MHDCCVKKILESLVVLALLSACGGNGEVLTSTTQGNTTMVPEQTEVTDTSGPTTTVPLISQSALPKMVDCPTKQISLETGETFQEIIRCVDGWAVGIPQRFVDKFDGDTDVEAEWVMTRRSSGWMVVGVCHMYHPIYSSGSTCSYPYGSDSIIVSLIPPMPVQCVLWDGARFDDSIPETGCPNSR
jgi:hypothetical protein